MFRNKKGVSPIIAAVLLVVITIAIGATTMAFIRGLSDQNLASAQEKSAKIQCGTDVSVQVLAIGTSYKICRNDTGSFVDVTLKNDGFQRIKRFKLTVLGDGDPGFTSNETANIEFETNTMQKFQLGYNSTSVGVIEEFILEPVIQGQPGTDIYCSDSPIRWTASDLVDC